MPEGEFLLSGERAALGMLRAYSLRYTVRSVRLALDSVGVPAEELSAAA